MSMIMTFTNVHDYDFTNVHDYDFTNVHDYDDYYSAKQESAAAALPEHHVRADSHVSWGPAPICRTENNCSISISPTQHGKQSPCKTHWNCRKWDILHYQIVSGIWTVRLFGFESKRTRAPFSFRLHSSKGNMWSGNTHTFVQMQKRFTPNSVAKNGAKRSISKETERIPRQL